MPEAPGAIILRAIHEIMIVPVALVTNDQVGTTFIASFLGYTPDGMATKGCSE